MVGKIGKLENPESAIAYRTSEGRNWKIYIFIEFCGFIYGF